MTTIRIEFPFATDRPSLGIEAGLKASRLTAVVVELKVPGKVPGVMTHDDKAAMYAALFGGA